MESVTLRHKDASRQAWLYAFFTILVAGLVIAAFVVPLPAKWAMLIFVPVALFLAYSTLRLATLRVRLDERGIWEPSPFALTKHTPWEDVARVRKKVLPGAMKMRFLGIEIVHRDGDAHEIVALKMQGGAAYAEQAVEEWVQTIREAKKKASAG